MSSKKLENFRKYVHKIFLKFNQNYQKAREDEKKKEKRIQCKQKNEGRNKWMNKQIEGKKTNEVTNI